MLKKHAYLSCRLFAQLFLQKQIALDDESEQLLHAVVVGSQLDALFLEEHEFVVGQAAADSITGGVLQEAEGHLVDSIVGQIRLQAIQILDLGSVRKSRAGIDTRVLLEQAAGVERLKRNPPRVDAGVTFRAAFLVAVTLQFLAESQLCAVVLLELRHVRRRIVGAVRR